MLFALVFNTQTLWDALKLEPIFQCAWPSGGHFQPLRTEKNFDVIWWCQKNRFFYQEFKVSRFCLTPLLSFTFRVDGWPPFLGSRSLTYVVLYLGNSACLNHFWDQVRRSKKKSKIRLKMPILAFLWTSPTLAKSIHHKNRQRDRTNATCANPAIKFCIHLYYSCPKLASD